MSAPTLGTKALFLPNRKGTLKRDNNRRAKAHRMALQSVRGDVDTREPASMKFSRAQLVDMKKLQQEAARAEHVEKCNRKLVDKMMMIMQGFCGTIVSEQTFPDFNPGTLNYRIRQRELVRIDRANLALMHRLETASSGYNKALVKPKYFQQPHMGLFPRSEQSVKSAGSKSRKRIRPGGPPTAPSCGSGGRAPSPSFRAGCGGDAGGRSDDGGLGWGASVTSALTEPSSFPTTTLGKFHDASSPAPVRQNSGEWRESGADVHASELRIDDPHDLGGGDGVDGGSVHPATGLARTPHPPSISSRATCGSLSGKVSSKLRKCRRLARPTAAKPGATVFQGGVRISDDYAMVIVTRATEGFGDNGTQGFRIKAYFPLSVSVYTLGVSAVHLPAFTAGSRTAVRRLFQTGDKSRGKWEGVVACLELRPSTDVTDMRKSTESMKSAAGPTPAPSATATETGSPAVAAPAPAEAGVLSGGMDGTEERVGGSSAGTAGAAAGAVPMAVGVEMVLVPPEDAPVLVVQRLVRGWLTRQQYQSLKRSVIVIQAAIRGWKYRVAKRKHEAVTRIAAVSRGKRCRNRVKQERAARGIQKRTRSWLRKRDVEKDRAATQIQAAVKRRNKRLGRDMRHVAEKEESPVLVEGSSPAKTSSTAKTPHGSVAGAPGQGCGHKQPRRSPRFAATSTESNDSSGGRQKALGGGGVEDAGIECSDGVGGGERGARGRESRDTASVRSGAGVGGSAGKSGSQVSGGRASRRDRGQGGAGGKNNSSNGDNSSSSSNNNSTNAKPAGGGDRNRGKVGGGAPTASGKVASTPPRNQRPKPPDPKDFTRSPYNRPRVGWVRGGGGGGARGTPASNGKVPSRHAGADRLRPAAPPRPSDAPGSPRPNGDRSLASGGNLSSGGAQSEGVSVAPPPLPKSARAAPEVAGAWPSGGAGTRTAKAAAKAAVATPTTNAAGGTPDPGPSADAVATGKKKGLAAAAAPPPRAVGSDQQNVELSSEAGSQKVGPNKDKPTTTNNNGKSVAANRQQRSSSIPWVEEAATGKHYRPPPPTTAAKEPAGEVHVAAGDDATRGSRSIVGSPDTGQNSNNNTNRNNAREAVADGGGGTDGKRNSPNSGDRNRRTSSVSWAEDIAEGNRNSVQLEPSRLEVVGSAVDKHSAEAALRAGSSKGEVNSQDGRDPNRRTSSVSWAEDIVEGNEGSARQQPSPQKNVESSAAGNSTMETKSPGESTSGQDNRDQNRRTSSVSWAEDIVEGKGGSTRHQPSPQTRVESVIDNKTEAASPGGNSNGQDESNRNRRTSSVSWAEDIVEGRGRGEQPLPSARNSAESAAGNSTMETKSPGESSSGQDNSDRNRRTSSVSWAEEIVEGKGGSTRQKPCPKTREEAAVDKNKTEAASSGGDSIARDNSDQNRRTSSVSWAEDIVAEKEGGTQQRLSPQENAESEVD
ncbi:unnamed protein product, partial [Ectocarpus fasciculatus]